MSSIARDASLREAQIDFVISKLSNDIIQRIGSNAGIPYSGSIFRPKTDLAMLLFKPEKNMPSEYTINLNTLKPTMNSINKTPLSNDIISILRQ